MTFEEAVNEKLARWREEYSDLERRTVHDVWALIAAEVKKYARGDRSSERDRQKLVTVAAMAKLGWEHDRRGDWRWLEERRRPVPVNDCRLKPTACR